MKEGGISLGINREGVTSFTFPNGDGLHNSEGTASLPVI